MKLFLDVDALHKLGSYDALSEALAALHVKLGDVWIPTTAKFKLRLKDEAKATQRHGAATAARLRDFVARVNEVTEAPTAEEITQLENIQGLDQGELILIVTAARTDDSVLLTGDKKALRALSSEPRCSSFAMRLAGRIICFEQVLESLMRRQGFEWLHDRVSSSLGTDSGVSQIVAPGIGANEENACDGFRSTISHLRSDTGALLVARLDGD